MENYEAIIQLLVEGVSAINTADSTSIPVGISNRHVHLSDQDVKSLFGDDYQLTVMKELSQPGQYAGKETLTICGPKGAIEKVRVLGPTRSQSQVEILAGDCFKLGIKAIPKLSGDLSNSPGITLIGPNGSVQLREGVILAKRHIHMKPSDAQRLNVRDGQEVKIEITGMRGGTLNQVSIRATNESSLECHLDVEEANALGVTAGSVIHIVA